MKPRLAPVAAIALLALSLPASAGFGAMDLPRLSFPDPNGGTAEQGCGTPGTLTGSACRGAGS